MRWSNVVLVIAISMMGGMTAGNIKVLWGYQESPEHKSGYAAQCRGREPCPHCKQIITVWSQFVDASWFRPYEEEESE